MAAKKKTAQAAEQPVAPVPAEVPATSLDTSRNDSAAAESTSQPGLGHGEQLSGADGGGDHESGAQAAEQPGAAVPAEVSEHSGLARDGVFSGEGLVLLEVSTRLPRRIRGGVIVTQVPQTVTVTKEVAALIEADPYIMATRK